MNALLVRHAKAGDRSKWTDPDHLRPLTRKGRAQAVALVDTLAGQGIGRILSSPFVRCVQTVEPLAAKLGLDVETTDVLAEDPDMGKVVDLVRGLATSGATVVLSTHGDVIPMLLDTLEAIDGLELPEGYPCAKGSTWVLTPDPGTGRFVEARYIPAP